MYPKVVIATVLCLLGAHVQAQDYTLGSLTITHPWARATPPGAAAGGGFMQIVNGGKADRLVAATADVAQTVELHEMAMDGNVMRMRKLENGIPLPAGGRAELKPGGLHVMFIDLKAPLREGEHFPLRLRFEKGGEITVQVEVGGMAAGSAMPDHPMH